MRPEIIPATTTDPSQVIIPSAGLSVEPIFGSSFDNLGLGGFFSADGVLNFLDLIWSTYALFAYIFSIFLLIVYVYAATRYRQLSDLRAEMFKERERIYDERFRSGPKNDRLADMHEHIESDRPNDWKLAIIEADIILDESLKDAGYLGSSLGERLRSISTSQLNSLDDAWQAHKVRNQIAHGGADFILTKRLADDTIKQYLRVFNELGIK